MNKIFCSLLIGAAMCIGGTAQAADFTLTSPQYKEGDTLKETQVFNGFGCKGGNISPELTWSNPPEGTKSFAVMMFDPDAPTGSGWWHWVVFDIPADARSLKLNASKTGDLPKGSIQSVTDFGTPGYGGACPPIDAKPHRYVFRIFALDVPTLALDAKAMPALVGFTIAGHKLGEATLITNFGR